MSSERDPKNSAYIQKALDALNGKDVGPGKTIVIQVRHNETCPRLNSGECNCVPEIEIVGEHMTNEGER